MEEETTTQWPQMVINNMPKNYNKKDLEKLIKSKEIIFRKLKSIPNKNFAFITFDSEEERDKAITLLHDCEFRKHKLHPCIRDTSAQLQRKRPHDGDNESGRNTKQRIDGPPRTAKSAVCPWWDVPYEEQLTRKTAAMRKDCLEKIVREVKDSYMQSNKQKKRQGQAVSEIPGWLSASKQEGILSSVEVLPIIPSPQVEGYRNKCEFTFGHELQKSEAIETAQDAEVKTSPADDNQPIYLPALGFRVSSYSEGVLVGSPDDCPTVPDAMKQLVRAFTNHLRNHTELTVYDQKTHSGVWRLLTCRFSERNNQMVAMLCVSLKNVPEDVWATEELRLKEMVANLTTGDNKLVTGLCVQVYDGLSVPASDHPVKLLYGEDVVTESMNDCTFRVSPQAFFQVNTPAAEVLYSRVVDALKTGSGGNDAEEGRDLLCLDVCCGTGTIGICCARAKVGGVVGVDICGPAIDDANENAKLNGLRLLGEENGGDSECPAAFVCSRAEGVLESILNDRHSTSSGGGLSAELQRQIHALSKEKKVLAVVDPPREGLHVDCLKAIRNCSRIDRLVYVSCNPTKSLVRDCTMLCGPSSKKYRGAAFRPVQATPVDLFPMTPHCEMLLVLERCETSATISKE